MANRENGFAGEVLERDRVDIAPPKRSQVVLLNDDSTTQDFVVHVLESVFFKSYTEAYRIMLNVHEKGEGVVDTFPTEVAKSKVSKVTRMARAEGFPLRCIARPLSQ